jgi:hypothetical protein
VTLLPFEDDYADGGQSCNIMVPLNELVYLPPLNQVAIVKGLTATLDDNILSSVVIEKETNSILLTDPIGSFIVKIASVSTENGARLLALKSLDTVLGRWRTILMNTAKDSANGNMLYEQASALAQNVLEVALVTWESPPSRQIESAIPGLFQSLVRLMQILDQDASLGQTSMDVLVCQILKQPSTRKGKYVALEALLPKIGASKLIDLSRSVESISSTSSMSSSLVSSFLTEIGRRGNSSAAVAELLAKVLSMLRAELHAKAGIDICKVEKGNRKERRKKEASKVNMALTTLTESYLDTPQEETVLLLDSWLNVWAPPLATALLASDLSFRTQIAAFCLPLLATFVGGKGNRINASHAFAFLLDKLIVQGQKYNRQDDESLLWAKFEVSKK